jgi:hypothetical protein
MGIILLNELGQLPSLYFPVHYTYHFIRVGITTDYKLDDQGVGIQSPAGIRDISLLYIVQTCCEAYPSWVLGDIMSFSGRDIKLTTHLHLM